MTNKKNGADDVLSFVKELSVLIEEYDLSDDDNYASGFDKEDPLIKLKRALSEKLVLSTGKSISECEIEAEEILDGIEKDIADPTSKAKICSVLKLLSADISSLSISTISGVIAGLVMNGVIFTPFISALPTIGIAVASMYIFRIGIEFVCSND